MNLFLQLLGSAYSKPPLPKTCVEQRTVLVKTRGSPTDHHGKSQRTEGWYERILYVCLISTSTMQSYLKRHKEGNWYCWRFSTVVRVD